ncbi:transcription factor GTE12-like isoform X2 [Prosopis cineraria]|uniref:transcription factor GTE12-like isoform X2 n=1 Tax=Prosopis cineraria TaxID=364024 RepID=UPI00240FDCAF|nr:transcription factor GTE12-like isoform X2 [Prosopis cineraria]
MIATETIVPNRKLKIKFSTKRIEVNTGTKCELDQKVDQIDDTGPYNLKEKSSLPGSNKRGPPGSYEGQKEKRQKMDRRASLECASILKSLTSHPYSWVFSKPVDPVALNIPDYFSIISEPMDLGTIKSNLEKNVYSGAEEFAADVRLTFSNAMRYNPPSNDVHLMAKELNKSFEKRWKDSDKKWKCGDDDGKCMSGTTMESMRKSGTLVPPMRKVKSLQRSDSLTDRDDKVEVSKSSHIPLKLILKNLHKGSKDNSDGGRPSVSVKPCPSSSPVSHKVNISDDSGCRAVISSDSSCVISGSEGRDACGAEALELNCLAKGTSLQGKSDPDFDGAVSALDSDCLYPSSPRTDSAMDASSGEVLSDPNIDVQLSPKKALRAAILKCRFADTILKAQQKTLLDHGDKADHVKLQQEKEKLERVQREERARIEAQIKAAESAAKMRAEEELKQQREREREAARMAIQKVERTVDIEHNLEILKELEMLSGCTLYGSGVAMKKLERSQLQYPLERLGLFIKDEFKAEDDDEVVIGNWE